jgi:hypothetical protein
MLGETWVVKAVLMQSQVRWECGGVGQWIKDHKMAKNLAELGLCCSVSWNVELASNDSRYLGEVISEQSVEGEAWLLLTVFSKMPEERNDLK